MVKLRSLALHTVGTVPWGEDDSHVLPDVMLGAWNVPEFPLALSFGAAGLYWIEGTVIFCPFTAGALLLNWPTGLLLNVQLWQTGPSLSFSVPPLDVHWALVESTALANWAIFILQCSPPLDVLSYHWLKGHCLKFFICAVATGVCSMPC